MKQEATMHTETLIIAILAVAVGLTVRLLLLGSGAAQLGFLPPKWTHWLWGESLGDNTKRTKS
jgi:hypothetical protein